MHVVEKKLLVFHGSLDNFLDNLEKIEDADRESALGQEFHGGFPQVRLYKDGQVVGSSMKKDVCNRGVVRVVPAAYNFLKEVKQHGPLAVSQLASKWGFESSSTAGQLAFEAYQLTKPRLRILWTDVKPAPNEGISWDITYHLVSTEGFSVDYRKS
jgi:hypothetical protein